jgi:hypothetical protein
MKNYDLAYLSRFFTPHSLSGRFHTNFIFRFGYCALGDQTAADLVGVSLEQVFKWDDGEDIPLPVRKVWLYESGREIPKYTDFENWSFIKGKIITPNGISYTAKQMEVALYYLDEISIRTR